MLWFLRLPKFLNTYFLFRFSNLNNLAPLFKWLIERSGIFWCYKLSICVSHVLMLKPLPLMWCHPLMRTLGDTYILMTSWRVSGRLSAPRAWALSVSQPWEDTRRLLVRKSAFPRTQVTGWWENKFLLFQSPSLWYFVMTAWHWVKEKKKKSLQESLFIKKKNHGLNSSNEKYRLHMIRFGLNKQFNKFLNFLVW